MQCSSKYVEEFLNAVCGEIRYKGVHENIVKELTDHIEDQKAAYLKQGLEEEAATLKSIEQMGDPIVVGMELDKAHRPKTDWSTLSIILALVIIGGVVQYLFSTVNSSESHSLSYFLAYASIGLVAFAVMYFFDYTLLGRFSKLAYFVIFMFTIISTSAFRPSYRYIYYFVLLFIPVFAGIIYSFRNKGYLGIISSGLFYIGLAFLCLLENSFTSLLLLTVSCLILLTVAILRNYFGVNRKVGLAIVYLPMIVAVLMLLFSLAPFRTYRLATILNPEKDPMGAGYISNIIKCLFSTAKPIGTASLIGNFQGKSIDQILPAWSTDFPLTYIIASFGYLFGIVLIALMIILIARMFISIAKQKNAYGLLVALSVSITITAQIAISILANLGVIVPFSVTLPFISFGAAGYILNMGLIGLLISVYRRTNIVSDGIGHVIRTAPLFAFVNGKLIIDFGSKLKPFNKRGQ